MRHADFARRTLLAFLLAATILTPFGQESSANARTAATAPSATAERTEKMVQLAWTGLEGPVSIYRTKTPDAPHTTAERLTILEGTSSTISAAPFPRPYFLLRDAKGNEVRTAERLLPLEGGSNFRDLGGYRTFDGRQVTWGKLYRSAVMSSLTPDDFVELGRLGIQTVCDFRSTDERGRDTVNWPEGVQPVVLATDYGLDMEAIAALFRGGPVTAEATRKAMTGFYTEMPFTFADQYARMLRALVDGKAPLTFNCSAGKDRTGLASALLLTILGVPYETVMDDYLLSNQTYRPKLPVSGGDDPTARMFASLPADAREALMGVEKGYLDASFAEIEARGGMDRYIRAELRLTEHDIRRLRQLYSHPANPT